MAGHEWIGFPVGGLMGLFWLLTLVVILWVVRSASGGSRREADRARKTALELLEACHARGEIDTEAYRRMRRELEEQGGD